MEFEGRFNSCTKVYPDGHLKKTTFNFPVYNPNGLYTEKKERINFCKDKNETRSDSLKRGIDKVYDIAFINDFTYFVTFTLDKRKIDRYDYKEICSKLKNWLKNSVQRNDCIYLIVPELHEDGAVHFHGLISGNFNLHDSGLKYKGRIIYSLKNWHYGFTTCIELDDNKVATASYICKYITKDTKRLLGNLYYSGGKGLKREVPKVYDNISYYQAIGNEYQITNTGLKVKYYEVFENEEN